MTDWIGFRITGFEARDGLGVTPCGRLDRLPPADELRRRRFPELGEENVRDLLLLYPELLCQIFGTDLRLVLRELHRVDLVAFEADSRRTHLIELKHHAALRPDDVAIVQIRRHEQKTRESIRERAVDSSWRTPVVTPWVLTSRLHDERLVFREGSPKVLRFGEFARGRESWLGFQRASTLSPIPPAVGIDAEPLLDTEQHRALAAELEGIASGIATVSGTEFAPTRRVWVLNLLGDRAKDVYVTVDLQPLPGGPFVTLTCSAKVADAVEHAVSVGGKHDRVADAYLKACSSVTSAGGEWQPAVVCDDQLRRTCWRWGGSREEDPWQRARLGTQLVRHLAEVFLREMAGVPAVV